MNLIEKEIHGLNCKLAELEEELKEWELYNEKKNDLLRDDITNIKKHIKRLQNANR